MDTNMENYPAFSSFRQLMTLWDYNLAIQEVEKSIHDLMDKHGMILFFKKDDEIYGAPEDSRVIFAKLKSDDEDEPMSPGFRDEAKFMGINLLKSMFGSPEDSVENLFGNKDIPNIHVCNRDDVVKTIMNYKPKKAKKEKNGITVRKR